MYILRLDLRHIIFIFVLILSIGCTQKDLKIFDKNSFKIEKNSNTTIEIINLTDEDFLFESKLKEDFLNRGINVVEDKKNSDYRFIIKILSFASLDKKSTTQSILENVNLGISIGHIFGNVGVHGSIGTKVGNILGDSLDSKVYQMVVDLTLIDKKADNESYENLIIEVKFDENKKSEAFELLKKELIDRILELI